MKLSPDDPKLTAYALGELNLAEAAAVEQELKNSAELREAVEEIRATAEFLKKEFATEEPIALSPKQRDAIASQIPPTNVVPLPKRNVAIFVSISAIAACVMFVLTWGMWFKPAHQNVVTSGKSEFRYAQNAEEAQRKKPKPSVQSKPPQVTIEAKPQNISANDAKALGFEWQIHQQPAAATPPVNTVNHGQLVIVNGAAPQALGKIGAEASKREQIFAAPAKTPLLNNPSVQTFSGRVATSADKKVSESPAPMPTYQWKTDGSVSQAKVDVAANSLDGYVREKQNLYWDSDGTDLFKAEDVRDVSQHYAITARYPRYLENSFESVLNAPLSTVSVDVDTASYANVRRFLNQNQLPPRDAVRIEELVNYFSYNYPQPHDDTPFSVNMEVAGCPWNKQHRLVRVGLKGKEIAQDKRPPSNFVFLIDVSGSMSPSERLPLIKQALRMLVKKMTENDRIAMVVYASSSGVVLDSTSCVNKEKILEAIDRLEAGGSTNGGEGIQRAYRVAEENFVKGGVNRVILATDGDFNVGITDQSALIDLIQKKAKSGVFLTALGVGTDNYKDALMQKLADKGNGNYFYLDTLEEAQKVLIQQMNGTLVTIAKDVKIQIEFNPAQVQSYRLIGYEKRVMEAQDFNNDKKDAGEIGAGHTVTALYEIVPTGADEEELRPAVDDLKYQSDHVRKTPKADRHERRSDDSNELLTLKLRYKKPDGDKSKLLEFPLTDDGKKFSSASTDFQFATAVASFGMLLKDSQYRGNFSYDRVREVAESAKGDDKEGYRAEFINLVKKAKTLSHDGE